MPFYITEVTHAFLVTNELSAADLVHADFLPDLKNAQAKDLGK